MTPRFFNTAGPINPADHYNLSPLDRINLPEVLGLIEQKKYFVLHAPRQTGKTTCLLALRDYLNHEGKYDCVYANFELGQSAREDVEAAVTSLITYTADEIRSTVGRALFSPEELQAFRQGGAHSALHQFLKSWVERNEKPVVLMIDEIDALIGDTLISVLRQLRAGYTQRPASFPQSIILCGVRDVRDYRIHSSRTKEVITGGSAFNIKAKSLRLGNFTQAEVEKLYLQHTAVTGQTFEPDVFPLVWEMTAGQPWLVNALAYEACFEMKEGRDRPVPITVEVIQQAKENLILRRETHLDQLADKLREDRVRRVIEPILAGDEVSVEKLPSDDPSDDVSYVRDLGLITPNGTAAISNAIYREVIPRELTYSDQIMMSGPERAWYVGEDGLLLTGKLLESFQQFFRENSEIWLERFDYKEAGPQLLLQAFLQRIVNGGGMIEREYGLGRRRTDLLIKWPFPQVQQRIVIELKLLRGTIAKTIEQGLEQTLEYAERSNATESHLVVFDRLTKKRWSQKIFKRTKKFRGHMVTVWGM